MTKYKDGTEMKEGDRVLSPNGRTGTLVRRGERFKTSLGHRNYFTTIDDKNGLLDCIIHDKSMIRMGA